MTTTVRLASVNANNLFSRWNFTAAVRLLEEGEQGLTARYEVVDGPTGPQMMLRSFLGRLVEAKPEDEQMTLAGRILAIDADVVAVQEVEDLTALQEFAQVHLGDRWPHLSLVEGNDARLIDVAVLSRLPLGRVTSHRHAVHPDDPSRPIFSRDLAMVEILSPDRSRRLLRLYTTHLKSNYVDYRIRGAARAAAVAANHARRRRQAEVTAAIVTADAAAEPAVPWVVCGDFNAGPDHPSLAPWVQAPIGPADLLEGLTATAPPPPSRNPVDVPPHDRWSHRFSVSGAADVFELLDQVWGSRGLVVARPTVHRRATWTTAGTDHDPVSVELEL